MKKNFIYATLSAIALVGAVSLTSCSSNEDVADVNPTYDGEAVKTQFSISLPFGNKATTRQAYSTVQAEEDRTSFRGMSNIVLIPYANATNRTTRLGGNISLGENNMLQPTTTNSANSIPSGQLLTNSNAVLYKDVNIPVGTAGFLFYGVATGTDGFEDGSLTPEGLTGESAGISFKPTSILTNTSKTSTVGTALATYVSSIAAASYDNGTPSNNTDDIANIWAKCANTANQNETWYNSGLGEMYNKFTSMKAGASSYVQAAIQDLYTSIFNNTDIVSLAIKAAILNSTYASDATTSGTLTFTSAISGYPADIDMPEGAAALSWNGETPNVATAATESNLGNSSMNTINMNEISYPASLYYYVNSSILTSNTSRKGDYNNTDTWNTILGKYDGSAVSSATRSVAIKDLIQYAVGRLDVKVNKMDKTNYFDRKGDIVNIPVGGYELTGVLIGGQKAVDYEFTQILASNTTLYSSNEYTIYDKTINTVGSNNTTVSKVVTTSADAGPTYTLALETRKDQSVYVALEFLNNGDDFQGVDGIVKSGCKFYMIAQLKPDDTGTGGTATDTNSIGKVFKQDYKTIANFTFGAGAADGDHDGVADTIAGFGNAYVTIPDLRTPQLELGLSVDLRWETGIEFNVTF